MRLLELFAGTGSIGRAFHDRGWEVVSLDLDPQSAPTIVADILAWDYTAFPSGHFDMVWASPVCTMYSIARTTAKTPRDLEWADSLVARTLEIIDYYKPRFWAFENPASGLLKGRPIVAGLPFKDCCYCRYNYKYRKWTRIWGNLAWVPRMCDKNTPCEDKARLGVHTMTAQRGPGRGRDGLKAGDVCSLGQLYSMPPQLCDDIAVAASTL